MSDDTLPLFQLADQQRCLQLATTWRVGSIIRRLRSEGADWGAIAAYLRALIRQPVML